MKGAVLARVQSVRLGHAERALVHAVDDDGREYKLEVPPDSVRGLAQAGEHVLLVAWSLHALPRAPEPATTPPLAPEATEVTASVLDIAAAASTVDEEFMVLLSRGHVTAASSPPATMQATASQKSTDFAELFGLPQGGTRRP